ncbi:MAG: CoB--CoM heterodisulfide reductase iron-sulfur subunit A family protein [Promethearchaeota archaeon]|nr:MAG: CoB--CoM heterodisulfide reductase iron-sulfur subunit A family protein [Candidatus Lokiarchaeota archaeon]
MAEKREEDIRIGVFVCSCGTNIGGLLDVKALADYAKTLSYVAYTEDNLYTCSEVGLKSIRDAIEEYKLNRVIVASCTPRTHESLFRECISEAGLNEYLFQFVNIRDQCSWVHTKYAEEAFEKAKDLIRMGVAKVFKLEPLNNIKVEITPKALVLGGGITGMSAALSLSNQGYKTYLVEKEQKLGGRLNRLFKLFPYDYEASELLKTTITQIHNSKNIDVYTSSQIKSVNGFVGNYEVEIEQKDKLYNKLVGAIVIAVGSSVFTPSDMYGYDGHTRITQYELESKLKNENVNVNDVVMIQCVGARIDKRPYCSAVCCMTAIKNSLIIKEQNPNVNITILYRDIYTPGTKYEKYYKEAREKGILFIKYTIKREPKIEENRIRVFNENMGENIIIPYDLLVLSTPLIANEDNQNLGQMLKVPLEANNFFLEAHVKLRPNDFATDGIFLGGSAKWPVDISTAISQGYGAASRASTILSHKNIEVEGATSYLPEYNRDLCTGCEVCIEVCPYHAIEKNEDDEIVIIEALCKGCGLCGASCTKKAIEIKHFTNEQILSEIYALGGREII